jgi:pyroglutamyl-peptidase
VSPLKILITGFAPFGGQELNPAYEALKLLPGVIEGASVVKAELPTVFGKGAQVLRDLLAAHLPQVVLCLGQAGGRPGLSVERVAINLKDAAIPDNEGNRPADELIRAGGRAAYFSTLPTRRIVRHLQERGIPADLSYTAGTFVCNEVFYSLLQYQEEEGTGAKGGFIHVPYAPEQAANFSPLAPSLPIATVAAGVELAIALVVNEIQEG